MKVLYLPGILGSVLTWSEGPGGPPHVVWLDPFAIVGGELASLQLGQDGLSPGPLAQGRQVAAPIILPFPYGPLARFMALIGWDVLALPFDWRLSTFTLGQQLWPVVQQWAAGQPIFIVAHSQGGLVARAIYGQMLAAGLDAQLARIVTIGTPHFGSLEPVRLWFRLPILYAGLASLTAVSGTWPPGQGPGYLDAVLATHPAWFELMAWAAAGPLFQQFPQQAAAIYQPATYAGGNPFVTQLLMTNAELVQGLLAPLLPANRLVSVAGIGERTPFALAPPAPPQTDAGWQYTQQGDGLITVAQASPPGAAVYTYPVRHDLQPLHPLIWAPLPNLVTLGHP